MAGFYYIRSKANKLVLEVANGNTTPGTPVFPKEKGERKAQQWRDEPATGTIRSRIDDLCLDIEGGQLVINPYLPGNRRQQLKREGDKIVNRYDKMVLQLSGPEAGAPVIMAQSLDIKDQAWTFELAD